MGVFIHCLRHKYSYAFTEASQSHFVSITCRECEDFLWFNHQCILYTSVREGFLSDCIFCKWETVGSLLKCCLNKHRYQCQAYDELFWNLYCYSGSKKCNCMCFVKAIIKICSNAGIICLRMHLFKIVHKIGYIYGNRILFLSPIC